jgi:hypothetical protein
MICSAHESNFGFSTVALEENTQHFSLALWLATPVTEMHRNIEKSYFTSRNTIRRSLGIAHSIPFKSCSVPLDNFTSIYLDTSLTLENRTRDLQALPSPAIRFACTLSKPCCYRTRYL